MMTSLETKLLNSIAHDEYNSNNGAEPESAKDVYCWSDVERWAGQIGESVPTTKGALGSLTAKGFVQCWGTGRDASVAFTEAGFIAYLKSKKGN